MSAKPAAQGLLLDAEPLSLTGELERVIFHNPDNGFCVLRLLLKTGDSTSCVGILLEPRTGSRLRLLGHWANNPRFGRQFEFSSAEELLPASREGIRLYLSSGLIKGLGAELASRIVDYFGEKTLEILDSDPERLREVRGIGPKNLERIRASWAEHLGMRDLLLFVQPQGVSPSLAVRIYRVYGADSLSIVKENPYRLAMEIHGIGFQTADAMAAKLGFAQDHPLRIQAGCLYLLQKASDDGHVFLPQSRLRTLVCAQLACAEEVAQKAIDSLIESKRLIREAAFSSELLTDAQDAEPAIYLQRFHHCESKSAYYLTRLIHSPKSVHFAHAESLVLKLARELPIELAARQLDALRMAAEAKILLITGGPGTGKTTLINAIIRLFESARTRILLAAPTGRAAKRMAESSQREARTIHRLLEYSPKEDGFARNEDNPLSCGLLVVDEASMMDNLLFFHLLKAVPLGATLILVGDVNQLPSVGPGNVLGDLLHSGVIPIVELKDIFRQSAESEIICNAHLINKGELPRLESNRERLSDFYFIHKNDPEEAAELIVEMIKQHIPRKFGLNPIDDVQLLTPMHRGAVGSEQMNARLQAALNPNGLELRKGERAFRLNDKVMQIRNNYEKDIFNGDIGRISHIDLRERTLSVSFDERVLPYEFEELDELTMAYAISIHKAQGSEYPAVVIPLMMQHFMLLQRNLVYTGITRGKRLVILVGEQRALAMAVRNNKTHSRFTRLCQRIQGI